MNDRAKIQALLEHLDCGKDLRDFPGTKNEKLALIARVTDRRLIEWERARGQYRLTWIGRRQLAGRASLISSMVIATTCAAATVVGLWFWADASLLPVAGQATSAERARNAAPLPPLAPSGSTDIGPAYSGDYPRVANQPSPAPEITSAEQPKEVEHPTDATSSNPVQLDGTKSTTQPRKKLAKSRRNKTYASHRRKDRPGSTLAYTDPWQAQQHQYFNYGGRGAWAPFR
jgi:hypothetical protein